MTTIRAGFKQFARFFTFLVLIPKTATGLNFAQNQFEILSPCGVDSQYNGGNLLKTLGVVSSVDCARHCNEHEDCYSINVGPDDAQNKTMECHLLAASFASCSDLTTAEGWTYYRKIQALETATPNATCKSCSGDLTNVLEVNFAGSIKSGDKIRLKEAVLGGAKVKIVTESSGILHSYRSLLHVIDGHGNIHFMPKTKFEVKSDGRLRCIDKVISTSGNVSTVTRLYENKTNETTVSSPDLMTFYIADNSSDVWSSETTLESLLDGVSKGHALGVQMSNSGVTEVFQADPVISDARIQRVSAATHFSHKLDHPDFNQFFQPMTSELKLVSTNNNLQVMMWPWTSPTTVNMYETSNSNVEWTIDCCWEPVVYYDGVDPTSNSEKSLKLRGALQKGRMVKVSYFDTNGVKITIHPELVICFGGGVFCYGSSLEQGGRRTDSSFDFGVMQGRVYNSFVRAKFDNIEKGNLGIGNTQLYYTNVTWYAETRPSTVVFDSTDVNLGIPMLHMAIKKGAELQLLIKNHIYEFYIRVSEAVIDNSNGMWLETVDRVLEMDEFSGNCVSSNYPQSFNIKLAIPSLSLKVTSWKYDLSMVCEQDADFPYQSLTVFAVGLW